MDWRTLVNVLPYLVALVAIIWGILAPAKWKRVLNAVTWGVEVFAQNAPKYEGKSIKDLIRDMAQGAGVEAALHDFVEKNVNQTVSRQPPAPSDDHPPAAG